MSSYQRRKGKAWEQDVARVFRDIMPGVEVKRGWQSRDGSDDSDVVVPCFWVECKCGALPNIRAALAQADDASDGTGKSPVAIIKDDRKPPIVAMYLDDWKELVREWWAGRQS